MKLYTYEEASGLLSISLRSLERLVKSGGIPGYRVGVKSRRIKAEDLDLYISNLNVVQGEQDTYRTNVR